MNNLALFGGVPVRQETWPTPRMIDQTPAIFDALVKTLQEGLSMFTSNAVGNLEQKLVEVFHKHYAVAVSSGTAALETALYTLGIRSNLDEVIVPSATYISSASSIIRNSGKPIFVDCDATLTLSIEGLHKAINQHTKAVIFVSLFGNPGNITEVYEICKNRNIPLIHDCAQGAASKHNGQWIASIGDIVCLSFFETKHLAGGEGGALLMDREDIYKNAKSFSNLFEVRDDGIPTAIEPNFLLPVSYHNIGTNYRLPTLTATLVSYAIDHLEETKTICLRNGEYYLKTLNEWGMFPFIHNVDEIGWYGVPIILKKKNIRNGFWKALHLEGTPIARYYYTCLPYNEAFERATRTYPMTESLVANALVLPTHKAIGLQERVDITNAFTKVGEVL